MLLFTVPVQTSWSAVCELSLAPRLLSPVALPLLIPLISPNLPAAPSPFIFIRLQSTEGAGLTSGMWEKPSWHVFKMTHYGRVEVLPKPRKEDRLLSSEAPLPGAEFADRRVTFCDPQGVLHVMIQSFELSSSTLCRSPFQDVSETSVWFFCFLSSSSSLPAEGF